MPNVFIPKRTRAVWRRRWRRSGRPRAAILAVAAFMTILPFLLSTNTVFREWISNRALAASAATVRQGQGIDIMTERQRLRHGQALRNLVMNKPDALLKLDSGDILIGFSMPDLQRREGTLQIWQYRTGDCVLDIFFDGGKGAESVQPVIHYEVRPRQKARLNGKSTEESRMPDATHCVRSLKDRG